LVHGPHGTHRQTLLQDERVLEGPKVFQLLLID
jgi:hypothetical protein